MWRESEREISVLIARHDDDDDDDFHNIYIYIYMCVCVCVCVCVHLWLNNKDKFYLYNFIRILPSFLTSVLVLVWS